MHVERQMVSSFTAKAILLGVIIRALCFVFGLADAKNTALGAIGSAIKHEELLSGIPHGCGARGNVSNGLSPIKIVDRDQRRTHHVIRSSAPVHPEPAVSWHSGFRGGAHARPKTTPVSHAARRRVGVAARSARAAAGNAGRRPASPDAISVVRVHRGCLSPRADPFVAGRVLRLLFSALFAAALAQPTDEPTDHEQDQ